jgi:tagatose 1,6-diphosphate aldolase GatY/KbaY
MTTFTLKGKADQMLVSTIELLQAAEKGRYAIGAFNIYDLEGVRAVVNAAEAARSPVLLQILPGSFRYGGLPLVALCLEAARQASVPMNFQLDHSASAEDITACLESGVTSIMVDGSQQPYMENVVFTREMAALVHEYGATVEGELGLLSGIEDGYTIEAYASSLTDPDQVAEFVEETGVDVLAICVGNVHGHYPSEPRLDFARLTAIHKRLDVPLVMHGASELPEALVRHAIQLGIRKFNVNTKVREAYLKALHEELADGSNVNILDLKRNAVAAMQAVITAKMELFGSVGKA